MSDQFGDTTEDYLQQLRIDQFLSDGNLLLNNNLCIFVDIIDMDDKEEQLAAAQPTVPKPLFVKHRLQTRCTDHTVSIWLVIIIFHLN